MNTGRISAEDRAEIKREVLGELRDALGKEGTDLDSVRKYLDDKTAGPTPLTLADVKAMSPEQVNEHWSEVAALMESTHTRGEAA